VVSVDTWRSETITPLPDCDRADAFRSIYAISFWMQEVAKIEAIASIRHFLLMNCLQHLRMPTTSISIQPTDLRNFVSKSPRRLSGHYGSWHLSGDSSRNGSDLVRHQHE
jgi:hypothetical protein